MGSQVIDASSLELFWSELFEYTSPYVSIGAFVLSMIPLDDNDQTAAEQKILQKLSEISAQIKLLQLAIAQRLAEQTLRERSGEVLGIKDAIDDFAHLHSQGMLDNIITDSAITKGKIVTYLRAPDTPIDFFHAYNTLLCTLIPLRITCFALKNVSPSDLRPLLCGELKDLLEFQTGGAEAASTIGRNRVSRVTESLILVDELGPIWGTEFAIQVDGKVVYTDSFMGIRQTPKRNISDVRHQAERVRQNLSDHYADLTSQDIRRLYATATALQVTVCV